MLQIKIHHHYTDQLIPLRKNKNPLQLLPYNMKRLFCLSSRTQSVCENALKKYHYFFTTFSSSSSSSTVLPNSQTSSPVINTTATENNKKKRVFENEASTLYKRISPVGDPNISIIPILDQWVQQGNKVEQHSLNRIITTLSKYRRFKHALEISVWMADKRYIPPTKGDIMSRLHLIYKVYGLGKAEEFYNNISQKFKCYGVDTTLLNIYSLEKSADKAEALMQKLRETGCLKTPLPFTIMLNLYYNFRNWERMDELTNEMEKMGLYRDKFAFTPQLCAYAANGNIQGFNKTLEIIEADPRVEMDCSRYLMVADALSKAGLAEKCFELLKKVEKMAIKTTKGRYNTLNSVLRLYADIGEKDEVHRIWKILGNDKIYNTGYRNMISSLLKFDDFEGAERIFKEWEAKDLSCDIRIPNIMIDVYAKLGNLEKAEYFLNCGIAKGGSPSFYTWYRLMIGYFEDDQIPKGVEALKNATLAHQFSPSEELLQDKLVILLKYLERRLNVEELEGFLNVFELEGIFSSTVCGRLLNFIAIETLET
uniref:pentatricopeptide repeat-containing protein At2g20710, mitochondrial-like n=1 Tax=Erigeron canadensis TaxID=72917 RepID=UPI001CB98285|nr:pentatricopeptide repeat-containing protein At2g20710, mitochondrial-like [Erigeron canadensis]